MFLYGTTHIYFCLVFFHCSKAPLDKRGKYVTSRDAQLLWESVEQWAGQGAGMLHADWRVCLESPLTDSVSEIENCSPYTVNKIVFSHFLTHNSVPCFRLSFIFGKNGGRISI